MALSVGIVGLPNVGKSTLFNALTQEQLAQSANYPFCTIEPNKATVAVPDKRLAVLAEMVRPQKIIPATVDFIDIAGLVRGASAGEGLGNQFLGNIRDCAAILEVVRCFEDENIIHVEGTVDPLRDIETIETEMLLADLQSVGKRLERIKKMAKGSKEMQALAGEIEHLLTHLDNGKPASSFEHGESEPMRQTMRELGLLTAKPVIYCANINDAALENDNAEVRTVREYAESRGADMVTICAKLEEELGGLSDEEQAEILSGFGIAQSGLERIIHVGYRTLGLASYFTAGPKEVRAWTIVKGWKAPACAGVIHSDFERGFIRAEVIAYEDYVAYGSEAECRSAGCLRTEGKDYVMHDGDVVKFLFNV